MQAFNVHIRRQACLYVYIQYVDYICLVVQLRTTVPHTYLTTFRTHLDIGSRYVHANQLNPPVLDPVLETLIGGPRVRGTGVHLTRAGEPPPRMWHWFDNPIRDYILQFVIFHIVIGSPREVTRLPFVVYLSRVYLVGSQFGCVFRSLDGCFGQLQSIFLRLE